MKFELSNLKVSTLEQMPHKKEQTLHLIESSFQYKDGHNFATDFAPLMHKDNHANNFILLDQTTEQVIGHIGSLSKILSFNKLNIDTCFLGGICIHTDYQGMGLFKYFFEFIIHRIKSQYTLFSLWTGSPQLYLRFGFHLCGEQFEYVIAPNNTSNTFNANKLINLSTEDFNRVKYLYQKNNELNNLIAPIRTDEEWKIIRSMTSTQLFIKRNQSGEISEYYFLGKGEDLKGVIHEGNIVDLAEIHTDQTEIKYWSPTDSFAAKSQLQFTCLMRIANKDKFTQFINQITNGKVITKFIDISENKVELLFDGEVIEIGINDLLTGIFGPNKFSEFQDVLGSLYISGLDSI